MPVPRTRLERTGYYHTLSSESPVYAVLEVQVRNDNPSYGTTRETTNLDDQGATLTLIRRIRGGEVAKSFKQYIIPIKVRNSKEEMTEYLKHTEKLKKKREEGTLVTSDKDKSLLPYFRVSYPKTDIDGSYFVESSWTEAIS